MGLFLINEALVILVAEHVIRDFQVPSCQSVNFSYLANGSHWPLSLLKTFFTDLA